MINSFTKLFAPLLLTVSTLVWSAPATALWLGLGDGDYDLNLATYNSGLASFVCPAPIIGTDHQWNAGVVL